MNISGKTTFACHMQRQYEVVRRLQSQAITEHKGKTSTDRRPAQFHSSRDHEELLLKMHSSKDVHNFVPFVALDKSDSKGLSAIRKIFKATLSRTGIYNCNFNHYHQIKKLYVFWSRDAIHS